MDITHDNVCSSMLSCFYSHLLSTGRPISSFSLLINAVILLLNYLVLILHLYMHDLSFKHYLDLYITDSALKVS